uniref:Uncharacterized protein n=1 Tax=Zea mays TaxID=4577 RepID=A0A804UFQ6_MAIZE
MPLEHVFKIIRSDGKSVCLWSFLQFQNTPLHLSVLGGSPSKQSTTRTALPQDSSISVVVPIQWRAGGSDVGDDP